MGRLVDDESVDVDDGSVQLLMMPCVLVVMVLLFLVTACSGADGEVEKAGAVSVVSSTASISLDDVESKDVESAKQQKDGQDDRMIQPEGHTGIWFETMPSDPLEKLVYESQRFVGDPVELEPLGDKALMPQWADMPDPCHPEVMRRMGKLGFEDPSADKTRIYDPGLTQCGVLEKRRDYPSNISPGGFYWGTHENLENMFPLTKSMKVNDFDFEVATDAGVAETLGCSAMLDEHVGGWGIFATHNPNYGIATCRDSAYSLQIITNIIGDYDV